MAKRRRVSPSTRPTGVLMWHRAVVLGLLALLTLGSVALQNLHSPTTEEQRASVGSCLHDAATPHHHEDDGHDHGHKCPHDGEEGHKPEKCGICKQLHLAQQLIMGSSAPAFVVDFIEGPDGRMIAVIRDNRPALANAPKRGPPALDL